MLWTRGGYPRNHLDGNKIALKGPAMGHSGSPESARITCPPFQSSMAHGSPQGPLFDLEYHIKAGDLENVQDQLVHVDKNELLATQREPFLRFEQHSKARTRDVFESLEVNFCRGSNLIEDNAHLFYL